MFLPYPRAASVGSFKRPVAAAAADVTPNAVNWDNVVASGAAMTNTVTITGINTAIDLSISYTGYNGVGAFSVYKNGTQFDLTGYNPTTLSVSNNDQVYFYYSPPDANAVSVTVSNASDGNTVLDTFTMAAAQDGGGG